MKYALAYFMHQYLQKEAPLTVPRAFTLIELLIVVAIIAILAAIAVPNFLEAQTRAKVSRNKADMKSVVTGLEAYAVDQNRYPWPSNPVGLPETSPGSTPWFETKVPNSLTSPVAYLTSRFPDPYHPQDAIQAGEDPVYHLMGRDYAERRNELAEYQGYLAGLAVSPGQIKYVLLGHGPDVDHDGPTSSDPASYDPTNGTVSNGDILYFGPGLGFR